MRRERSKAAHARACRVTPGGVHSPVRAFGAVGGTPVSFARGSGSRAWDVDGNELVDFCMSWGPLILGHAHPAVVDAVKRAAERGLSYGACHEAEAELCELVLRAYPEHDRVRLLSSGTEAVMTALRLARAATGRELVVKFAGGYHGHSDALLVQAGSGLVTFGVATSAGVPAAVAATTLVAPLDDLPAVERLFDVHGANIAAVIIEPVPANNGLLEQAPAFLQGLRALCTRHGALLILDEVITGFRLPAAARRIAFPQPDLVTLGKIIGGGMPVGAVCGPAVLLDQLAPIGRVYQAGTLSGNPVAMAAGIATLRELERDPPYARFVGLHDTFRCALGVDAPAWLRSTGAFGSILWLYLSDGPLPRSAAAIDPVIVPRYRRLFTRLLERGFYLPPSAHEVFFLSTAHSEDDVLGLARALDEEAAALG
jgi:glutamate-1-semialdehyde 2,1-aminomutase